MNTICKIIGFFIGCIIEICKAIVILLIKYLPKIILGISKFLYLGIVKASKRYKILIAVYSVLAVTAFIFFTLSILIIPDVTLTLADPFSKNKTCFKICAIVSVIEIALISFFSIFEYVKEYPEQKIKKAFNDIFTEIGLYADENLIPEYLDTQYISPFLTCYFFKSLTPLSLWFKLKEPLEMYSNMKIYDINQSPNNLRIIRVLVHSNPLPEYIMWQDDYLNKNSNILNIGVGYYGVSSIDLERSPHCFIAGETGSGKSNILKCMIYQSIQKGYKTVLIDFKRGVSFSAFNNLVDVYYEYDTVINVLNEMVEETKHRLDLFRELRVDNIMAYNKKSGHNLKRIIIFIDELAELLKTRDKATAHALNDSIETLTRLSRAAGIHLIMGIQRPDSTVVSGQIKNNTPFRICGRFTDREPSQIMLNNGAASTLANIKGRFLIKDDTLYEVQCFYFADGIMNEVIIQNNSAKTLPEYIEENNVKDEPVKEIAESEQANEFNFDFADIESKK